MANFYHLNHHVTVDFIDFMHFSLFCLFFPDKVEFGEVLMEPPNITVKPRGAVEVSSKNIITSNDTLVGQT